MTYSSEVLADSPVLYFQGENNLTNSGSLSTGVTNGGVAYATGKVGNAVSLNSTNYWAATSTDTYYNNQVFTLEAWFKITNNGTAYYTIMRRSGTQHVILRIRGEAGGNNGLGELYLANSGGVISAMTTMRLDDGNWHHIAVVVDRVATTVKLYVDGSLNKTVSHNAQTASLSATNFFGQEPAGGERFNGLLDEVAVYPTALSAERITAHYNAGTGPTVSYFRGWGQPV